MNRSIGSVFEPIRNGAPFEVLLAGNDDRNPKLEGGRYDLVNNVIAGWANNNACKVRLGARVDLIGNTFVGGYYDGGGGTVTATDRCG